MTDDTRHSTPGPDREPEPKPEMSERFDERLPGLTDALREEFGKEPDVPASVDAAILARAHEHLRALRPEPARVVRLPDRFWRWLPAAAAAAVLALVFWPQAWMRSGSGDGGRAPGPWTVMDIDANGRVDIRDGFVLARRIQAGASLQPEWDVDGDGAVTRADVDRIAHAAVRLDGRSR